jgi:hypothetical protein
MGLAVISKMSAWAVFQSYTCAGPEGRQAGGGRAADDAQLLGRMPAAASAGSAAMLGCAASVAWVIFTVTLWAVVRRAAALVLPAPPAPRRLPAVGRQLAHLVEREHLWRLAGITLGVLDLREAAERCETLWSSQGGKRAL